MYSEVDYIKIHELLIDNIYVELTESFFFSNSWYSNGLKLRHLTCRHICLRVRSGVNA